jgi:DNA-binding winged helix-turn-helix (wHTH) protein/predicted Zn-dependent protease
MSTGPQKIAFGPFTLDLAASVLHRDGQAIPLRPQALRTLKVLVDHSGQHLDHEQMIRQAWDGVTVSKHTVTVTMGEVRRALGEFGDWIKAHPRLGYMLSVPQCEELLRIGWHHLSRRTREGLEKAVVTFEEAAAAGAGARAYEGASRAYLFLGSYGMRRASECHPKFVEAHNKVVALRGYTPELLLDHATALNVYERRFAEAEVEMLQVLKDEPKLAATYAQLAWLYGSWGQNDRAVEMLERARKADVLGPALALAEIIVRFCCRDFEGAVESGRRILGLHPHFPTAVAFFARALEHAGRLDEALHQHRLACMLAVDVPWYRVMEGVCLARAGRRSEAEAVLAEMLALRATTYVDGYHLSQLFDMLGDTDGAFRELEEAVVEGCPMVISINVDPTFDHMRTDPRFAALVERAFSGSCGLKQYQFG